MEKARLYLKYLLINYITVEIVDIATLSEQPSETTE